MESTRSAKKQKSR